MPVQDATVNRARDYIRSRAGENLTPRSVADALKVNPSYLSREFKRVTRFTVTEYIAQQKVDLACAMLVDPNIPIIEVAGRVGFNSLPRFYAVFKQRTGVTATEYRRTLHRSQMQRAAS
jgi:AraC-like DNA-binding protein